MVVVLPPWQDDPTSTLRHRPYTPGNEPEAGATYAYPHPMPAGRVHPAQPVAVLRDGAWVPALLDYWDRRDDGWHGHVTRYTGEPHWLCYVEWYAGEQLRAQT